MKNAHVIRKLIFILSLAGIGLLFNGCATSYVATESSQQNSVSLQVFYDELSPYGDWVEYPQYGYVWIPDAGSNFIPYSSRGQWIFTNYGWTWVSDYEWGWAPFHYGRWDYNNYYGWFWVPDYEWGPSWVTWRSAPGYYGWQPMRPGISTSLGYGNDYYNNYYNNYNDYWMFVSDRDFQRSNVSRYYVSQRNRDRIIRNSTVINNTYIDNSRNITYVSGPAREDVQRSTGRRVNSAVIRENIRPGQDLRNGQLQIYRPNVSKNIDVEQKPAPSRITSREDVKRPLERNAINQQRNVSPTNNNRQERRQNTINQQDINRGNVQREQQQQINQSENDIRQQQQQRRQNSINQQNIERDNAQREQQQKINQSENNRQQRQQQRQNNINQQNIDRDNAQREQQQQEQRRQNSINQQNIDRDNAQREQQQKVNESQNNEREQRQINRQEENDRNRQENENKKRQE